MVWIFLFSSPAGKAYFKSACETLIAEGKYKSGDVITIEIAWQTTSQFANYGDPIIQMWEEAFNAVGEAYGLTLDVTNWAGAVWSDVYYSKMMVGQFDIGFGSISGNALNPLNFLEVLKSDNSSGFTLNWGADTSVVNLEYNGVLWSFDSLWQAADTGGYFSQGVFTKAYNPDMKLNEAGDDYAADCYTENEDGTVTLKLNTNPLLGIEGLEVDVYKVAVSGYLNASQDYVEFTCEFEYDAETGDLLVVMDKEAVDTYVKDKDAYKNNAYHAFMQNGIIIILDKDLNVKQIRFGYVNASQIDGEYNISTPTTWNNNTVNATTGGGNFLNIENEVEDTDYVVIITNAGSKVQLKAACALFINSNVEAVITSKTAITSESLAETKVDLANAEYQIVYTAAEIA